MSSYIINALNFTGFMLDFYFPTTSILFAIVVGVAFGIFASIVPTRKAAETKIVKALRYE